MLVIVVIIAIVIIDIIIVTITVVILVIIAIVIIVIRRPSLETDQSDDDVDRAMMTMTTSRAGHCHGLDGQE